MYTPVPPVKPVSALCEEHWVTVNGLRIRYVESKADGRPSCPPVLLIHGLLGYSFSWRFNLAALANHANVYALDLPGVGFSERSPLMDCSLDGLASFVLHFMDAVGIQVADIVGTSHGGALAMLLAAKAPARVRRLVLVAPVNPWSEQQRWQNRMLSTELGTWLMRQLWALAPVIDRRLLERLYGDPRRIAPGTVEGYAAALSIPGTFDHLMAIVNSWAADVEALAAELPRINMPVLLIWGGCDSVVKPASAELLRAHLGNARLLVFPGVGHLPYEELPEEFNRALCGFLFSAENR